MNKTKNIDELRWVRAMSSDVIPHYLIEQVRDRDYSIEDFFRYHQMNCMTQTEDGIKLNPFNHLYVLANPENQVKGVLWFTVDPLSKDILIQTYSVDKEYWGKGLAVKKLASHIKEILRKAKLNKVYWVTNYEKHSMRYGFKRSKSVLMEYDPKSEKIEKKEDKKIEKDNDKKEEIKKEKDNDICEKVV
jgi:N-acetylglutamate synthase-like GNAT family acetyltransferase